MYHQDGLYNRISLAKVREFVVNPEEEGRADELLDTRGSLFETRDIMPDGVSLLFGGDYREVVEKVLDVFVIKENILPR